MGKYTIHKHHWLTWHLWHKWVGVVFSVFIILFCVSGIILNHRKAFSSYEVSRALLPESYHIHDWNQNIIKGTTPLISHQLLNQGVRPLDSKVDAKIDTVIAYGLAGVWFTDRQFREWEPLNDGLPKGIDGRKVSGVVQTGDGTLWCAALWDVYKYDTATRRWQRVLLPENEERISDITLRGCDTIVVASRSVLYMGVAPHYKFERIQLKAPVDYTPEVSLFKTVWMLHSGQLFGTVGELVVDFLAVVLIILCLTGCVIFCFKRFHRVSKGFRRWNIKWHNRFGAYLIILTVLLAVTGMCLRPPLMVPLALSKTMPIPGTSLDSDNAWQDKIRAIRWDDRLHVWLMSTSEGFYAVPGFRFQVPILIASAPKVSPMGITVFERNPADSTEWLIGSFAGLERWCPETGKIMEWFADAPPPSPIPSTKGHHVTGFSKDLVFPIVFEYTSAPCTTTGKEQKGLPPMPEVLKQQPMSLWNFALELHTGRMYEPFLGGIVSILFIFISGLLLTLVLVSGYIIYRRSKHHKHHYKHIE